MGNAQSVVRPGLVHGVCASLSFFDKRHATTRMLSTMALDESSPLDKNNGAEEKSPVLSLWQSVTQKLTADSRSSHEAYEQRLGTFRSSCYFAKPLPLSPMIAARFGWTNSGPDLLVCSECHAAVALLMHPNLSAKGVQALCATYKKRLATSHASDCSFRLDSERHLLRSAPTTHRFLVPACFSSVFSAETVQLMESPDPKPLLETRMSQLLEAFSDDNKDYQIENVVVPCEFETFAPPQSDPPPMDTERTNCSLPSKICAALGEADKADSSIQSEAVALLAICGWSREISNDFLESSNPPTLTVRCDVCLARAKLKLSNPTQDTTLSTAQTSIVIQDDSEEDIDEQVWPPSKIQRIDKDLKGMNPLASHRYYCPYVCGFHVGETPPTEPAWKIIVSNLLRNAADRNEKADQSYNGEEAFSRVRRILRAGIATSNKE